MINESKIELFESLNILQDLANKSSSALPNEICRFISDEFNLKFAVISEEDKENNFSIIGKSSNVDYYLLSNKSSIKNYDDINEACKYENNLVSECSLSVENSPINLISLFIGVGETGRYLLLLQHKILPSNSEKSKHISIAKLI